MRMTDLEPCCSHIDAFDLTEEPKLELLNAIVHIAEVVLGKKCQSRSQKKQIEID